MNCSLSWLSLLLLIFNLCKVLCFEFTFELEDNAKQCFYQDIKKGIKASFEFQTANLNSQAEEIIVKWLFERRNKIGLARFKLHVISGGKNDVDCTVEDPDGLKLNSWKRQDSDVYEWDAQKTGAYKLCFSNEFSTITHKVIYFSLYVGDEAPLIENMSHATALSQMESSCVAVHDKLKEVVSFQTHFRLREAHGRIFAEHLSTRVQIWSLVNLLIIIVVTVGQVFVLRGFFNNKMPRGRRTDT